MLTNFANKLPQIKSLLNGRNFAGSAIRFNKGPGQPEPSINATHNVDKFDKRILVWTGKYKKIEDVPAKVTLELMKNAKNRARIKLANWLMALTLVGCAVVSYISREQIKSGDSLVKRSLDQQAEYNKSYEKQNAK